MRVDRLTDVSTIATHHYHMNTAGLYRWGQPCFYEWMRRLQMAMGTDQAFDASSELFLRSKETYHIFQRFGHKFMFSDMLVNLVTQPWKRAEILQNYPNCFFVHGKAREKDDFTL